MEIKLLSWNSNSKLGKSITFLNKYTHYHIMHLETKHNSYTTFNVPTNLYVFLIQVSDSVTQIEETIFFLSKNLFIEG